MILQELNKIKDYLLTHLIRAEYNYEVKKIKECLFIIDREITLKTMDPRK